MLLLNAGGHQGEGGHAPSALPVPLRLVNPTRYQACELGWSSRRRGAGAQAPSPGALRTLPGSRSRPGGSQDELGHSRSVGATPATCATTGAPDLMRNCAHRERDEHDAAREGRGGGGYENVATAAVPRP
jgi:hypothetical protein